MSKRVFLFPVIVFLIYFSIDKACLLPAVKRLTQPDATYLYFDYKKELLDELERVHTANARPENYVSGLRKKTLIVLGSSRLLYFDTARFLRNYPDWELFNFSAPVTAPAYYAYILERIVDRGIIPDYIIVEADPLQYNDGADHFVRSNLAYSFDLRFILQHQDLLKNSEISYFIARLLFAGYKYPPDLNSAISRLRDQKDRLLLALDELDRFQRANRGAARSIIPRENWYQRDFGALEVSSAQSIGWIYGNYRVSERQFKFLELILDLTRKNKIPILLLRPQVSRTMQSQLDESKKLGPPIAAWEKMFQKVIEPYGFPYLDLRHDGDVSCNTFVDGAHMALDCYKMLTVAMMREYWSHYGRDGSTWPPEIQKAHDK